MAREGEVLNRPLPVIPDHPRDEFQQWLARFCGRESIAGEQRLRQKKDGSRNGGERLNGALQDAKDRYAAPSPRTPIFPRQSFWRDSSGDRRNCEGWGA
jgi:hypothetical protein